jgi:steroid delta-isomerase-like uncharacterized protein
MANQKNTTIVRTLFDEVFSKGNMNKLDELFQKEVKFHDVAFSEEIRGLKGIKEAEQMYKTAFPGKKVTIEDMLTADDKVIVRWKCTGTHKGELNGTAPTNRSINITGISIYRLANDKIVEVWQSWDRLGLYEQIGEIERTHAFHA